MLEYVIIVTAIVCFSSSQQSQFYQVLKEQQKPECFAISVDIPLADAQQTCSTEDLCKIGKEYLNVLIFKFYAFSRPHLKTFDILHAFLSLNISKLSTLKNSLFWPTLYILRHSHTY